MDALPPGSKVRFRVSDPELGCGSSWAVETAKKTGDVYVFHREGARWIKTSLHESGQWHYGTSPQAKALLVDVPSYFAITKEREEVAPGWARAKVITTAHSELRTNYTEAVSNKNVIDVPIDPTANATNVVVLLKEPGAARIRIDAAHEIATLRRADGGEVFVYATPLHLTEPIHTTLEEQIAEAKQDLREWGWDGTTLTRISINGQNDQGHMHEFDIAIEGSNAD